MNKKNLGILLIASTFVLSSCNGNTTPVDDNKATLTAAINKFVKANSYDYNGHVGFTLKLNNTTYASGIDSIVNSRSYAIEKSVRNIEDNTKIAHFGYLNHAKGVLEYSYTQKNDEEQFVAGYVIDNDKTVTGSDKVTIGLKNFAIPSSLDETSASYSLDSDIKSDVTILDTFLKPVYLSTSSIKETYTINSATLSTNDTLDLLLTIDLDEAEDILISVTNVDGGDDLVDAKTFIEDGTAPKAYPDKLLKAKELSQKNNYIEVNVTTKSTDANHDKVIYNLDGYFGIDYYDNTKTHEVKNEDGTTTTKNYEDFYCAVIVGHKTIPTNIYMITINADGTTSPNANSTTAEWSSAQMFDATKINDSNAVNYLIASSYLVTGHAYLSIFSFWSNLYGFEDESEIFKNMNKGYMNFDDTMTKDLKVVYANSLGTSYTTDNIVAGCIIPDIKTKDEDSTVTLGTILNDGNAFLASYTGFGSATTKVTAIESLLDALYPENV